MFTTAAMQKENENKNRPKQTINSEKWLEM